MKRFSDLPPGCNIPAKKSNTYARQYGPANRIAPTFHMSGSLASLGHYVDRSIIARHSLPIEPFRCSMPNLDVMGGRFGRGGPGRGRFPQNLALPFDQPHFLAFLGSAPLLTYTHDFRPSSSRWCRALAVVTPHIHAYSLSYLSALFSEKYNSTIYRLDILELAVKRKQGGNGVINSQNSASRPSTDRSSRRSEKQPFFTRSSHFSSLHTSTMKDDVAFDHIDDRILDLCTSDESVSSLLARDLDLAPGDAWKALYGNHVQKSAGSKKVDSSGQADLPQDALERALRCGKWGPTQPSDLFLRIYHDAVCAIEENPIRGMVSPSLMGSYGVIPLTILSTVPDIARHMSNVIVRAEKEVFLATNYWQNSVASKFLTDAIRELDRRVGARGSRVVVKIIYDRGSPKQLLEPHYMVSAKEYTGKKVNVPHPDEIPNIDLQVMNFHQPIMGTFHSKYMVVDRRIGILQSNNIQDNDNMEMMVHLEGPIVDSLYDVALISWHKALEPPLPSHDSPATRAGMDSPGERHAAMFGPDGTFDSSSVTANPESQPPNGDIYTNPLPEHNADDPHYDADIPAEVTRVQASVSPSATETRMQAISRHLNHTTNPGFPPSAPDFPPNSDSENMTPYIPHRATDPFPMALVNRNAHGPPDHKSVTNPQNAAWLSALRNARESVFIQTPTLNAEPLLPAIRAACERGVDVFCYVCLGYNDAGELLPKQGGHNELIAHTLTTSLSPTARTHLHYNWYVAKDQTAPITQSRRKRSCHVKLLIADSRVGIMGNGNQDTQSWFHSQEINVMVDSAEICTAWLEAVRRNQNTGIYGGLDPIEGVWRDKEGREAEGVVGVDPGMFAWARGVVGAVKRVQGTGGF
ncbi:hypothetical protein B0T19DRAFT_221305 [Cercophora scortea]|uniref:PLD phosphodiesterase domain-containing protein n=1 Tax=Cercophora scortea TaxID=314031 RepID=A0AAE0M9N7_9PEZI|nr:hypothetical protein B0T19DRAFT_221305 [Cercophora scortea]